MSWEHRANQKPETKSQSPKPESQSQRPRDQIPRPWDQIAKWEGTVSTSTQASLLLCLLLSRWSHQVAPCSSWQTCETSCTHYNVVNLNMNLSKRYTRYIYSKHAWLQHKCIWAQTQNKPSENQALHSLSTIHSNCVCLGLQPKGARINTSE